MKCVYKKNVNLDSVMKFLEDFLSSKGMTFHFNKFNDKVEVEGFCTYMGLKVFVKIVLERKKDEFIVDFKTPVENSFLMKTPILEMFGLGFIFRKKFDLYGYYKKLEDEFWLHINEIF